jgi:hypothetical protein
MILVQKSYSFSMEGRYCTNNKPVNSYDEYLTEFRKGPCSPILFHPGFSGTGLEISIDCQKLKAAKDSVKEAEFILNECSFVCSWGKKKYENTIWITHEATWKYLLWNDFNFVWKRRTCAFYLLRVHKKLSKTYKWDIETEELKSDVKYENVQIPGVKIKIFGTTDSTKDKFQCGSGALEYFISTSGSPYKTTLDVFRMWGYVDGLTLQSNPYDFRMSAPQNGVIERGIFALNKLTAMTGKRSLVFGHSYGNNIVMNMLNSMTQKEKDSLVREFIAIGPPFLGSLQAIFFLLGQSGFLFSPSIKDKIGWEWLSKKFDGLNPELARESYPYFDGLYEFLSQSDQIEPLNERILENKETLLKAGLSEKLVNDLITDLDLALNKTIVKKVYEDISGKKTYKLNELGKLVEDLAFDDFVLDYFKTFDYESVNCYQNPGVAVRVMYLSEKQTMNVLDVEEDTKKAFDDYRYPKGTVYYGKGDETVNLFSLLGPPAAWMLDWIKSSNSKLENIKKMDNGEDEDKLTPKKITFVEFGFGEDKKYSDNFIYLHCKDKEEPPKSKRFKLSDYHLKGIPFLSKLINKGIDIYEFFSSIISNPFPRNKSQPFDNFKSMMFNADETSKTCNHGQLVLNPEWFKHIFQVAISPDDVETDKAMIDTQVSDEVFDNFLSYCPTVSCDLGFEICWEEFKETFKLIK